MYTIKNNTCTILGRVLCKKYMFIKQNCKETDKFGEIQAKMHIIY